ncbi:hypothetical protein M409DRAFT_20584 [Zasmidium cellare ATCC 36951]|uniref:Cell wall protein n=1 Tax=Zasmidium cellare ATCC 36951 TaxID=1080233 RepID=A0A6A6CQL5_ZASCE|nr:uncharacterized protein M409DRAFT_20584 [Zasmidium cellare ATCC 36951]KAF2169361.1 hypothetical protein M409DRAFT_20584 [Zasmidium cellare ATCC 36951]
MLPTLLLGALLPFSLASPIARDVNSIVASINTIESNIATLNSTLNTFNKGDLDSGLKVLKIQSQTNTLGDSIDSGTSTAQASEPLNADDSFTVASAVLTLQPQVISLLDNIEQHKPAFDAAILNLVSVTPQVEQDLKNQNASTAAFSDAVVAKLADPYPSLAGTVTGPIFSKFNEAIALFSNAGGVIALPPLPI